MSRKDSGQKSTSRRESKSQQTGTWSTRRKLLIVLSAVVAAALIVVFVVIPGLSHPRTYSAPPPMTIDTSKQYTATIETGNGDLVLELFASDVPVTVNNFVFLARDGFYDGTTFHRVERDPPFVVQGGDPLGNGMGNPGYYIDDEITEHTHVAGALSMARTSEPNTNGCQFFICLAPQPHLDGGYSVFGQLIEGWDVLDRIVQGDIITRITIEEK
jgi:cyclophilin family peptidyl-prolyl cis-trans isomerase